MGRTNRITLQQPNYIATRQTNILPPKFSVNEFCSNVLGISASMIRVPDYFPLHEVKAKFQSL